MQGGHERDAWRRNPEPGKQASATSSTTATNTQHCRGRGSIRPAKPKANAFVQTVAASLASFRELLRTAVSLAHNRRPHRRTPAGRSKAAGSGRAVRARPLVQRRRRDPRRAQGAHAARARSAGDEQVRQSIAGGSLAGSGHRGRARRKSRAWPRGGAASVRACVVHSVFIAAASFCERCGAPCSASAAGAQSRADQRDQRGQRPERDGGGPSRSVMSPS